jgi:hypothetical protein
MSSQAFRSAHVFLLRIWREDMGNEQFEWRAYIQHVRSGDAVIFVPGMTGTFSGEIG